MEPNHSVSAYDRGSVTGIDRELVPYRHITSEMLVP